MALYSQTAHMQAATDSWKALVRRVLLSSCVFDQKYGAVLNSLCVLRCYLRHFHYT